MTVYTVIGHITNAILTIEQLQIPSNLSGGPQQNLDFVSSVNKKPCVFLENLSLSTQIRKLD